MVFRGSSAPAGAIIDYYMRDNSAMNAPLVIVDAAGQQVARLLAPHLEGVNRVIWNLRSRIREFKSPQPSGNCGRTR